MKKAGQLTGDPLLPQKTVSISVISVLETVLQKWVKVGQFVSDPLFTSKTASIGIVTAVEQFLKSGSVKAPKEAYP
jgi:hypothetical protein